MKKRLTLFLALAVLAAFTAPGIAQDKEKRENRKKRRQNSPRSIGAYRVRGRCIST